MDGALLPLPPSCSEVADNGRGRPVGTSGEPFGAHPPAALLFPFALLPPPPLLLFVP